MKLPNLTSRFYIFFSHKVFKKWKSTLRGLYYSLTKLIYYGTFDMFAAVDIETISSCNLKCHYCPTAYYDRGQHLMSENLFKKIIDELAEIRFRGRISPHFYGEPLLDDRLSKLLLYARQKLPQADIIIHTNGLLLTKKKFDEFLKNKVDGFVITLHNDLVKNKMDQFFKLLNKKEKRKIRILKPEKMILFNRGGLVKITRAHKIKRCFYIRDEIAINYGGEVVCTNDFLAKYSFGNVKNQSLTDIWHKPKFKQIRRNLLKGKPAMNICRNCLK
ncbi:MAG: SPASM domain-containing protein [Patescibacteria group bacterium]|jgi:8-amino-3,8-dideoxy-alpha-D-manno-octulosonate transaminase|nr:SPASM domain-containing protein [Patescibacteria group bacterium]